MNVLVTGGAGSVGRELTASLLEKGHRVTVLDQNADALGSSVPAQGNLVSVAGRVEDARIVREAVKGADAVIHLAWSFSSDPMELLESDLKGHLVLLDASVAAKVSRFFYASSAVVYGKPSQVPIPEDAPCLAEQARSPFYAIAKLAAEKLALAYGSLHGLPVTIARFWWSYGRTIGGRHLRDMIAAAQAGRPLQVPGGAGGSFLDHDDLVHAFLLAAHRAEAVGQIFNLATAYLEWREVAQIVREVAGSSSSIEVVPAPEWKGAQFLADCWRLQTARAERLLGFESSFSASAARQRLREAVARCCRDMK